MKSTAPTFRLTDSTLRDGSHAVRHQFTAADVESIVGALDAAGVPVIEVAHGDGLGGSSFNYGFSDTNEGKLIQIATETRTNAKIAALLLPGIGTAQDLEEIAEYGVDIARIATHCTEADIAAQHIRRARDLGMEVVGFLMLAHMIGSEDLAEQAAMMESYGANCVYVVDSAGAMTMDDVRRRVAAVTERVGCEVGIHAHHNLGLAVANSLAAIGEGAEQVDGCTTGLGAGAGNCPTELLVAACERAGISTHVDVLRMADAAEDIVRPIQHRPQIIDRDALMLGYAGVYGSFLLHAQRAAERYGVRTRDILLELGRRGAVGGQEDMIIDVALELTGLDTPTT